MRLRFLLYTGSLVLFVGVVTLSTLFTWRAGLLPSEFQETVMDLGSAVTIIWVGKWTAALAILYLMPVAFLSRDVEALCRRAHDTAAPADGKPTCRSKWLEETGLRPTAGQWLMKVFAMLGPLLAGVGTEWLPV